MEQPVLLKFSALPGSSLSKPRKGAVSEYGIAVGPASDIKAAHAQVRAAFKVTAANQQLLVRADAFDHQLMDVLSSAEKFAKSPALSAPPPGWDPATRQAQLQLTLFKQPKESTPRAAASASEGNPATPAIASSAAAKPVWSTVKKLIRQEPYVRIAADTGLYVLPGDKCVDFPVAFMIYLIARVIEKHSCDQLTAAMRKYTLWDQIRRDMSAMNKALTAAESEVNKEKAVQWLEKFASYLPDKLPEDMQALVKKHAVAIEQQLREPAMPAFESLVGAGEADQQEEDEEEEEEEEEEGGKDESGGSAADHADAAGSKTAPPGAAARGTGASRQAGGGNSSATPCHGPDAMAALKSRNAADTDDQEQDEEEGEEDEENEADAYQPVKKKRRTGAAAALSKPPAKPAKKTTNSKQGGKGKADEQASSPSRRKTKGRPKARGMGNPQASNLIDAEAKCG